MKDAYELARQNISKSADDGKKQYDRKIRFSILQPGDGVLVRGGPGKLRSHWEQRGQTTPQMFHDFLDISRYFVLLRKY